MIPEVEESLTFTKFCLRTEKDLIRENCISGYLSRYSRFAICVVTFRKIVPVSLNFEILLPRDSSRSPVLECPVSIVSGDPLFARYRAHRRNEYILKERLGKDAFTESD